MQWSLRFFPVALMVIAAQPVWGADVPKDIREMGAGACVDLASLDPYAPKERERIPKYCECTTDTYWASVPQSDFDTMMNEIREGNTDGPGKAAVASKQAQRVENAQIQCKEKGG